MQPARRRLRRGLLLHAARSLRQWQPASPDPTTQEPSAIQFPPVNSEPAR